MSTEQTAHSKITVVERDGLPPIKFEGELIGEGSTHTYRGERQNRWTEVAIWRTKGGRYVARVIRRTCWQGERDHFTAASRATAAELIDWLKEGEATLGPASEEAVESAVKNDADFASTWVEVVD